MLTRVAENIPPLILHTFLATVGGAIVWMMLGLLVPGLVENVPLLLSPLTWGPGLILGFVAGPRMLSRTAYWVWLVPVAWLAYGIWDECRAYRFPPWFPPKGDFIQRAWHIFFLTPTDTKPWGSSPLGLVIFTIPALSSIAYSFGAWAALRAKHNPR